MKSKINISFELLASGMLVIANTFAFSVNYLVVCKQFLDRLWANTELVVKGSATGRKREFEKAAEHVICCAFEGKARKMKICCNEFEIM